MDQTTGTRHRLYPDVQWHKHATADCYHCGATEQAHRLLWLKHADENAYLALCPTCYPKHVARAGAAGGLRPPPHNVPHATSFGDHDDRRIWRIGQT